MEKRVVVGIAVLAVLVASVIGLLLTSPWQGNGRNAEPQSLALNSFYFEASITTPGAPSSFPHGVIRSWYEAPDRTRWEFGCTGDPVCEDYTRVIIVDGANMLFYEPDSNTYERLPVDSSYDREGPFSFLGLTNFLPGPMGDEFADGIRAEFHVSGHEKILGIEVTNYGDMWWIDEEHSFVLRQVGADAGGTSFVVEITDLEYNPEFADDVFDFEPPNGSREAQSGSSSQTFSTNDTPEGFLEPGYLPPGYERASGFRAEGHSLWERTYNQDLTITQKLRAGGPLIAPEGTPVALRGIQGYESSSGSLNILTWVEGDLKITISGPFPQDEILRIAESMH